MLTVLFALLAGILTIAAPCTLPVLPILLGASIGQSSALRPVFIILGFVLSFAIVVMVFSLVTAILGIDQNSLRSLAVWLLLGFGLLMVWRQPFDWLMARARALLPQSNRAPLQFSDGNLGGFLIGTTLGLVWTPCAGPILASILTIVATSANVAWGGLLLLVYALGAAIPMLAIAYGGQALTTRVRLVARYAHPLQQVFGVVIIGFAATMYFQYDTALTAWLADFYPAGQLGL